MIKIYHNPRCRKSREALNFLQSSGHNFDIVLYLNEKLTQAELREIIQKLKIRPENLIRTEETLWKTQFKGKSLSDSQLINLLIQEPRLIQRPIVVLGDKAVIARPAEAINLLF